MYQVMLADDEPLILDTLKSIVDWKAKGFEIVGSYLDGSELLEALEYNHVDLIVTDIKMSQVTGLEVAKYIHEKLPYCKVLIISGYLEFQLAVEAMQYGVTAYITKPIDLKRFDEELTKVKKQLQEQEQDQLIQQQMRTHLEQTLALMKEKLFTDLAFGRIHEKQELLHQLKTLYPNCTFERASCCLCEFHIHSYQQFMDDVWQEGEDQLENCIQAVFRKAEPALLIHTLYQKHGIIGLLVIIQDGGETASIHQVKSILEETFNTSISLIIKQDSPSLDSWLASDIKAAALPLSAPENEVLLHEYKRQILTNLCEGNINTAQDIVRRLCAALDDNEPFSVRNTIANLLDDMIIVLEKTNSKMAEELRTVVNHQRLLAMESIQAKDYIIRIFDRMKSIGIPKINSHPESFVEQAKKYVKDHISEDISREDVAEALFICTTYLSRLFKQETGETFNQYMIRMKINRAIELLKNPRYKVYEVCSLLGYKTPRYFSNVFRSHTGMNPSEYRRSVLHLEVADDE